MEKLARLVENEKTSILTPVIGMKVQLVGYAIIFIIAFLSAALKIPTSFHIPIVGILIVILICIPIIGIFGLYSAINYIILNGQTKITTRGIIYNLLYLTFNSVLYVLIYFISKYGASV